MSLESHRRTIEKIDDRLITLLKKRMETALEIGQIKAMKGLPVFDEERERRVLDRALAKDTAPLSPGQIRTFMEQVMRISREIQECATAFQNKEPNHDCGNAA